MRRSFTEAQKRVVAARQSWQCSVCSNVLSSAFQIDHTVPLWDGGADELHNAAALCANCHAIKTQAEGIERAKRKREKEEAEAAEEAAAHERRIRTEVGSEFAPEECEKGVSECAACGKRYYKLFPHKCWRMQEKVYERLHARLRRPPDSAQQVRRALSLKRLADERERQKEAAMPNPFARFRMV